MKRIIKIIGGPLFLGIFVRALFLNKHEIWFDEFASLFVASQPLHKLLTYTALDTHPPLYFIILKIWMVISPNILFLRLLSLIFGSVSLLLLEKITQHFHGKFSSAFALYLFSLSPLHVYYSTEIRMYSLFVTMYLFMLWTFLHLIRKFQRKVLFAFVIVEIMVLYTHYFALFFIIGFNLLYFYYMRKNSRCLKHWCSSQLIAILVFVPWILFSIQFQHNTCWCFSTLQGTALTFVSYIVGGLGAVTIRDMFVLLPLQYKIFLAGATIIPFTLFIFGLQITFRKKNIAFGLFMLPIAMVTLISFLFPIFSPRSLIFLAPIFYIIISYGVYNLKKYSYIIFFKYITIGIFVSILGMYFINPFFIKIPETKENIIFDPKQLFIK